MSEGQEVEVKMLSVDAEKQRISLSLKALMDRPVKPGQEKKADEDLPLPADAPKPPRKTEPTAQRRHRRPLGRREVWPELVAEICRAKKLAPGELARG